MGLSGQNNVKCERRQIEDCSTHTGKPSVDSLFRPRHSEMPRRGERRKVVEQCVVVEVCIAVDEHGLLDSWLHARSELPCDGHVVSSCFELEHGAVTRPLTRRVGCRVWVTQQYLQSLLLVWHHKHHKTSITRGAFCKSNNNKKASKQDSSQERQHKHITSRRSSQAS